MRLRVAWIHAIVFLIAGTGGQAAPIASSSTPVSIQSNVVYGSYSGLALLMDVKVPAHANGYAVLHIPGSGFQAPLSAEPYQIKDPVRQLPVETPFLDAGFTVITINHRAAPRFKYPAAVEDAQRAARFIRAHAKDYQVDPHWLGLLGGSSGGHLVNLLATLGEGTDSGIEPAQSNAVRAQCVVSVMSPSDLLPLGQDGWAVALVTNFIDVPAPFPEEAGTPGYAERVALYAQASPISYVKGDLPEFLLIHGDRDKLVPPSQSQTFHDRLKAAGARVSLTIMPGVGHEFPAPYPAQAAAWMSECLKRSQSRPSR